MAHAHTSTADQTDAVLAAFLEHGALPDIAKRVNMSLAALANWTGAHAQLLANLHQLLTTRAKLLAAQLEVAALSALATVSSSSTSADEPKLRERALERQRKAANAILRHRISLERTPREKGANSVPHALPKSAVTAQSHAGPALSSAEWRTPNAGHSIDAPMPRAPMPSSSRPHHAPKPTLADRFAARRLAALHAS